MENTATTSAHTAGPWKIDSRKETTFIFAPHQARGIDCTIAEVFSPANAHLIAAAPEFLEYFKGFLDDVRQLEVDPDLASDWDWSLTKRNLEWLIDKAEGRS